MVYQRQESRIENMEFMFKPFRERYNIKKSPEYKRALRRAKKKFAQMNEDEKKQALAQYKANDMNLPGMPAFYPEDRIYSSGIGDGEPTEMLACGHRWVRLSISPKNERTYWCRYGHSQTKLDEEVSNGCKVINQ